MIVCPFEHCIVCPSSVVASDYTFGIFKLFFHWNFQTWCPYWNVEPFSTPFTGARVAQWVRSLDLTTHTSLSPIRRGFAPAFVNYKKGCTRLAAASDIVYQLLAHGRWFSPGTPASSTTTTGRHDITEILLKVALKHKKSIKINQHLLLWFICCFFNNKNVDI